jgi:CheY-like chemotaxis protein
LRSWGLDCLQAGTEAELLGRIHESGARILLLDSELDGVPATEIARRLPAGVQVILLVTRTETVRRDTSVTSNVRGYLHKPVRREQLYRLLNEVAGFQGNRATPASGRAASDASAAAERSTRILIAEDNPVNQRVALRLVEKLGYSADTVSNGAQALIALSRTHYDLVLMDCMMPELDGFETTRQIRIRENGRDRLPVIAMTANAMKGDRERCLESGMDDYLSKPIDLARLAETLERWSASKGNGKRGGVKLKG